MIFFFFRFHPGCISVAPPGMGGAFLEVGGAFLGVGGVFLLPQN